MRKYLFMKHTGTDCPIDGETLIVYKTSSTATPESHIHHPIKAKLLNWTEEELYMGRISEYAKYIPRIKYLEEEGTSILLYAHS
jgi:hypothetical protein